MISEYSHPWIKKIRLLERRSSRIEKRMFIGEGIRLLREALSAISVDNILDRIEFVVSTSEWKKTSEGASLIIEMKRAGIPTESASERIFRDISQTETSQGVLFVGRLGGNPKKWSPQPKSFWLVADAIQDPGNLGTMIRSAFASGCTGIVATRGTVDLYNPKVIRGSAGAVFYLPFLCDIPHTQIMEGAQSVALPVFATSPSDGVPWDEIPWEDGGVVVIGNEGAGVQPIWEKNDARRIHIPLRKGAESLNAAMAATVFCFTAGRKAQWI